MVTRSAKFFCVLLLVTFFLGMVLRFSFVRVVTFNEEVKALNILKGDKAIVWINNRPGNGWVVLQYPGYSQPYIARKIIGEEVGDGSVEVPGSPTISVVKEYGEVVVVDGTPDAYYGDSRSWGKGVRFDLILGKIIFCIPKGRLFSLHRWSRVKN